MPADLDFPPPLPGVHVGVNPEGHISIHIVSLGLEFEVRREVMTSVNFRDAVDDVSVENFESFTIDRDLLSTELGAECRQCVNFFIQPIRTGVGQV